MTLVQLNQLETIQLEQLSDPLRGLKNCWLSPKGKIVIDASDFDPISWHMNLAICILKDIWQLNDLYAVYDKIDDDYNNGLNATDILESMGWVRLQTVLTSTTTEWLVPQSKISRLSKQIKTVIINWCIANNRLYNKAFAT